MNKEIFVVLDNLRSAQNVGSFFRTCDVFNVKKIYLCGITATPPNKEIHKTALGATETVLWEHNPSTLECIKELREKNFKVFCIEQQSNSILLNHFEPDTENPIVLVFGNEVSGVDEQVIQVCENCIEIPQFGTKHSLNVSVAGGIALWDIFNKMNQI